jgi:hypothetical protein
MHVWSCTHHKVFTKIISLSWNESSLYLSSIPIVMYRMATLKMSVYHIYVFVRTTIQ